MTKEDSARVLIVFATWHGQTERIAHKLAASARRRGYATEVQSSEDAWSRQDLACFDRVVVCAGVHMQEHHREAETFVTTHLATLESRPSAFVSVSLAAGAPAGTSDRVGIERVVNAFLDQTSWSPEKVILAAGALHYTQYGFLTRWFMRRISAKHGGPTDTSRDHEMTDWALLERDAASFFPEVTRSEPTSLAAGT
ncbi:MAG: flavodoxin domain-containing protein [Myxococcota bacterium]